VQNKEYLTRSEAAQFLSDKGLPITRSQLARLATHGGGPVFSVFGNRSVYAIEALLAWANARLAATQRGGRNDAQDEERSEAEGDDGVG
jgi:hypothetical protein